MEFWAHINGVDYPAVLGPTIVDNLGEELDSMEIVIPHSPKIKMKPYDDVYVHDGWYQGREYGKITVTPTGHFYRHFLVHNYSQNEVNQIDHIYNYSISLISETKYLERIALPNRTITIPLNRKGKSVLDMAKIFVERYTPKIKYSDDYSEAQGQGTWEWKDKFIVSDRSNPEDPHYTNFTAAQLQELEKRQLEIVSDVLSGIQAQEVSFNNPTLREVLTKIFSVSNRIPVVYDGVIFARNLLKKHNRIVGGIKGKIWDTTTMDGDQYVDRLRKNYASGLTDKNGVIFHEYVGFRNMNVASMRYSDLTIELRNPIYKINKFLLCFYTQVGERIELKKLDLTSFVVPSSTRALLSNDYLTYEAAKPTTINGFVDYTNRYVLGMCDYKFMTVQYDIGSNVISGFGETIKYTTNGVDFIEKIVLENILSAAIEEQSVNEDFEENTDDGEFTPSHTPAPYNLGQIIAPTPIDDWWNNFLAQVPVALMSKDDNEGNSIHSNNSLKMKSLFFEVEYQGIMSAASYVSKDMHDGDIVSVDNQQESLAVMELDGLVSKFKANRLGNEVSSVTARVVSADDLVEIGDYDDEHGVCYKRTIGVEKDYLSANYIFAKDYVITNYFTGVFSKYRSSAYASVAQSVERNEIANVQLLLSADKKLRNPQADMNFSYNFGLSDVISTFFGNSDLNSSMAYFSVKAPKQGEYAYDEYDESQLELQYFSTDRAYYMSGNSMCCSFGMTDSETAGTYIRQPFPNPTSATSDALNIGTVNNFIAPIYRYATYGFSKTPLDDITGTAQDFLSLPKTKSDGSLEDMNFFLKFSHIGGMKKAYDPNDGAHTSEEALANLSNIYYEKLYKLPKLTSDVISIYNNEGTGVLIKEDFKDAKEIIHETFQIEPISQESGIKFSPYFLKLSEIYNKAKEKRFSDGELEMPPYPVLAVTDQQVGYMTVHAFGMYVGLHDKGMKQFAKMLNKNLNYVVSFDILNGIFSNQTKRGELKVVIYKIVEIYEDRIIVEMSMQATANTGDEFHIEINGNDVWIKQVSTGVFRTTWWSSQMLNRGGQQTVNRYYNSSDGTYPNQRFYPDALPNTYPQPGGLYDPYYSDYQNKNNGVASGGAYFESTIGRKCYSFNFDLLPANPDLTITLVPASGAPITNISFVDLSMMTNDIFSCVYKAVFTHYDLVNDVNSSTRVLPYGDNGPKKAVLHPFDDFYEPVVAYHANVLWAVSANKISATFDPQKVYESTADIAADGMSIIPLQEDYQSFVNVNDSTSEISIAIPLQGLQTAQSAYMFYYDDADEQYHFVFGCDGKTEIRTGTGTNDLPIRVPTFVSTIYASMVYDRSRTVHNADMEPVLMTANYRKVNSEADNICVDKNEDNE